MYGLKIIHPAHWRGNWSAEIGRQLAVQDSSYGLFIFEPEVQRDEVLAVLQDVPRELYQLFEVTPTDRDPCYRFGN